MPLLEGASTIKAMSVYSPYSFSALLRGARSLGERLANRGYRSIPSVNDPDPNIGEGYFGSGPQIF
jgi:hypothetical protein